VRRNPTEYAQVTNPHKTADLLGISAIMVQDMAAKRINNYPFDMERMTSFEGDTGTLFFSPKGRPHTPAAIGGGYVFANQNACHQAASCGGSVSEQGGTSQALFVLPALLPIPVSAVIGRHFSWAQ